MTAITYQAMPPEFPLTRADRVVRVIIPVFAVIGLVLLFGFYLPEAEDRRILAAIVFLFGFPLLAGGLHLAQRKMAKVRPPASSDLLADDEGLTWRHNRWLWRELSAFEACDLGPKRRFIWFNVPEDRLSSKSYSARTRVAPGRSERRIPGPFDTPLEDIAARLNDMRRHALGDAAEDEAIPNMSADGPAEIARVYFADVEWNHTTGSLNMILYLVIIGGLYLQDLPRWIIWVILAFLVVAAILIVVSMYFSFARFYKHAPADNFLALDGEGLSVTRHGRKTSWSWREVSAFRTHGTGPVGRALQRGFIIVAEAPDDARLSRLWRLVSRLLFRRPVLLITDKYLAPAKDIAATLNAYRDRALGGGDATGEVRAPAPEQA